MVLGSDTVLLTKMGTGLTKPEVSALEIPERTAPPPLGAGGNGDEVKPPSPARCGVLQTE